MASAAQDWRTLEAGRELDALVAERVMGLVPGRDFGAWPEHEWKRYDSGEVDTFAHETENHNGPVCVRCGYGYCEHCLDGPAEPCEKAPPGYSTRILGAWHVVERLERDGLRVTYRTEDVVTGHRRVEITGFHPVRRAEWLVTGVAPTAPLAICRAALAATDAHA